jgi:hypothetical protein
MDQTIAKATDIRSEADIVHRSPQRHAVCWRKMMCHCETGQVSCRELNYNTKLYAIGETPEEFSQSCTCARERIRTCRANALLGNMLQGRGMIRHQKLQMCFRRGVKGSSVGGQARRAPRAPNWCLQTIVLPAPCWQRYIPLPSPVLD